MTTIRQEDLVESIAAALQYISYYHPADYIAHLARAYQRGRFGIYGRTGYIAANVPDGQ